MNFPTKVADKMPKVQIQNEPWSRVIYAKPIHTFEREGSKVSFDNKTFTCVYANFCSISITINPILCENWSRSFSGRGHRYKENEWCLSSDRLNLARGHPLQALGYFMWQQLRGIMPCQAWRGNRQSENTFKLISFSRDSLKACRNNHQRSSPGY